MNMELVAIDPVIIAMVAFVLPILQAVIQRPSWSSEQKTLLSLVIAVAAGCSVAWWSDIWSKDGVITAIGAVLGATQISYLAVFKSIGLTAAVEQRVNAGTTVSNAGVVMQSSDPLDDIRDSTARTAREDAPIIGGT